MKIGMGWGSDQVGHAWGEFPTVEAAAQVFQGFLRRIRTRWVPGFMGDPLVRDGKRLLIRMCTDGVRAVQQGKPWRAQIGDVWVSLFPRQ
jgi:hypothetical protein